MVVHIDMTPVPKARPRAVVIGGHARLYTPATTRAAEQQIAEAVRAAADGETYEAGTPVTIDVTFGMPIPKTSRHTSENDAHHKKPDVDNLVKTVLDGINASGVWRDDSQVTAITATKIYAKMPYINIKIEKM